MMHPILVLPPAVEPVSLATAKVHLRVMHDGEDEYIAGLLSAAREYTEGVTRLSLVPQTWELVRDEWPCSSGEWPVRLATVDLPNPPVLAVESVRYTDAAGEEQTMPSAGYTVGASEPWRITWWTDFAWPRAARGSIRIRYRAGYVPRLLQFGVNEEMDDDLAPDAGTFARVIGGEGAGLYEKGGAAGAGSWVASPYPHVQQVPARAVQLILIILGHWYVNREASITGTITGPAELAVQSLTRSLQRAKVA